jgi:hypothetical protein
MCYATGSNARTASCRRQSGPTDKPEPTSSSRSSAAGGSGGNRLVAGVFAPAHEFRLLVIACAGAVQGRPHPARTFGAARVVVHEAQTSSKTRGCSSARRRTTRPIRCGRKHSPSKDCFRRLHGKHNVCKLLRVVGPPSTHGHTWSTSNGPSVDPHRKHPCPSRSRILRRRSGLGSRPRRWSGPLFHHSQRSQCVCRGRIQPLIGVAPAMFNSDNARENFASSNYLAGRLQVCRNGAIIAATPDTKSPIGPQGVGRRADAWRSGV